MPHVKHSLPTRIAVIVAACLFLPAATCNDNTGKVTPAPVVFTDQTDCPAACANLRTLGCAEANPIVMGTRCTTNRDCKGLDGNPSSEQSCSSGRCVVSCESFCVATESSGVWLDPGCVAAVKSCSDIEKCPAATHPTPTCEGPACPPSIRTN